MNKKTQKVMFSSKNTDWATPQNFYKQLKIRFNFDLDPCATPQTAKCKKYFTEAEDGLSQDWGGHTVFMNPPYGREIKHWIKKAYDESRKPNTTVVCLIPSRTDTKYWHKYCMEAHEVYFIKGRLKFGGGAGSAPFPSAVVVFKAGETAVFNGGNYPKVYAINAEGERGAY
jgi:site-specific DNA-methyltransferase (adenine-specific)